MILFFLLGLLITVYIINRIYFGSSPKDILIKEAEKTRKIFTQPLAGLLTWKGKDIGLVSYHLFQKTEKKGFGYSFRGIFTTIYQENILIVNHKVTATKSEGFTIVLTERHEIWYDNKNQVYINGEILGEINDQNQFENRKLRRVFGWLSDKKFNKYEIFNEDGQSLGAVREPEDWDLPFPRALETYTELSTHELITFKVLACKKIVEIYLSHHKK